MPRKCTVCAHQERAAIDQALVNGDSLRYVSKQYDVTDAALFRHNTNHLPAALTKAHEAKEMVRADDLLSQVKELQARAMSILDQAEDSGDLRTALSAIREARGNLELLAKLLGKLQQEGTTNVNILVAPEWLVVRAAILTALTPYPDARLSVAGALSKVEYVSQ